MSPVLTIVVPCFNSAGYMRRCIDSLLSPGHADVEVVIVDDGSHDETGAIADDYAARHPDLVRVIHKENGGHGSAINAGLRAARGAYFKVVDSDDWLDRRAFERVIAFLRGTIGDEEPLDLLVTNFVYEKQGRRIKRAVSYRRALPRGRNLRWDQVRSFGTWQYMLMHSMIYRTGLLRDCELHVPERSFYVDNYVAFVPLRHVQRLHYLDVNLYRYFIGRSDQSVNETVMMGRIDQQLNINLIMVQHLADVRRGGAVPDKLDRYLIGYATLLTAVSSVLLVHHGEPDSLVKKRELWHRIDAIDTRLGRDMRRPPLGMFVSRTGPVAEHAMRIGYRVSKGLVGFN